MYTNTQTLPTLTNSSISGSLSSLAAESVMIGEKPAGVCVCVCVCQSFSLQQILLQVHAVKSARSHSSWPPQRGATGKNNPLGSGGEGGPWREEADRIALPPRLTTRPGDFESPSPAQTHRHPWLPCRLATHSGSTVSGCYGDILHFCRLLFVCAVKLHSYIKTIKGNSASSSQQRHQYSARSV